MPQPSTLASQVIIKVDGAEVQPQVMARLAGLTVDQHSHLPYMFTLRFVDSDLNLLDHGPFDLTKGVEIQAQTEEGKPFTLIHGEITALEPEFAEGMVAELVVRGFDRLHRLYRVTRSKAYLNVKDSDLASEIARSAGLNAKVDTTSMVYDHVFQHNQSDLAFLSQRAWRIGYECFVEDGTLYFRKPSTSAGPVNLHWGDNLLSFHPRMTLSEQVDEVVVKGWDVEKQQPIVGRAQSGSLYAGLQEPKDGAAWAQNFGNGRLVLVDLPVASQAEADALASARLDEISGAFVEAEGVALRRPDIRAGQAVTIKALGERFSGTYLVTSATHVYTPEGLRTRFRVSGARTGLLANQIEQERGVDRWPGVVLGLVTNTDDPLHWGRVKLKFPWLSDEAESAWARVMGAGAGSEAGQYNLPDVGDEVLVAFEHGDFSRPFVLGGVWNGQADIPPEAAKAKTGEAPLIRTWRSRKGHHITFYDQSDGKVEIVSVDGRSITLDDKKKTITLKTSGVEVTIEDNQLSIESQGQVNIKAASNLKIEANGNLDIQASGNVTIKGSLINLN